MSAASENLLSGCGCCEGVERLTPARVENAPGLSALVYRVGTHARFKASMQAELSRRPALSQLTTRGDDDASLAVIDACATMLDVLTFYQERIANEGFLRTATERRSLLELARAVGYELGPGVAAATNVAYQLMEAPGSPKVVTIERGTKVQSVPGPGEKPQTFEAVEEIEARAEWNAIRPQLAVPALVTSNTTELHLKGTSTGLSRGEMVMLVLLPQGTTAKINRVLKVVPDIDNGRTCITLEEKANLDGEVEVYALRERLGIFGHNAPYYYSLPTTLQTAFPNAWDSAGGASIWSIWDKSTQTPTEYNTPEDIYFDRQVSGLSPSDYVVLQQLPGFTRYFRIAWVNDKSVTGFALGAKVTGVILRRLDAGPGDALISSDKPSAMKVRTTNVYTRSEPLELAPTPVTVSLAKGQQTLDLEGQVPGLHEGQLVVIRGETAVGEKVAEVRTIAAVTQKSGTQVEFDKGLEHDYERHTVTINANVARATHGDTRREVLGSGDASQPFQSFTLKQTPLTYVQAPTASGGRSTLEVRIDDLLWHEVPTLYGRGAQERVYTTRMLDDGKVVVQFGDGKTGARLPSGTENVIAVYRVGVGTEGNVQAGQLSTLLTRPLGLRDVANPLSAEAGADRESRDRARQNAPRAVRTLDRVVSLLDYEDFARGFNGVGKAQATWVWNGEARVVHLTIAGDAGEVLGSSSAVRTNLAEALDAHRDPLAQVRIDTFEPVAFQIKARLWMHPDHDSELVLAGMRSALREAFAFEARAFGQAVTRSEMLAVMQRVEGVQGVDLDAFFTDQSTDTNPDRLPAKAARWNQAKKTIDKAQLVTLHEAESAIDLTEVAG